MGHKIHPKGLRLGYTQDWQSRWFSPKNMPALIMEDFQIRQIVESRFMLAAVSAVGIERAGSFLRVNIHTARPGLVIGKKGADIETLRKDLEALTGSKTFVNVVEIKNPETDAKLVAQSIAFQIEKRAHYGAAMKKAIEKALAGKALGIKIMIGGRLGGAEIARTEWKREGRVPLHTLCADIDYGTYEANTISGKIGIKVWIFKKMHFAKSPKEILNELRKHREMQEGTATEGVVEAVVAPVAAVDEKTIAQKPAVKKKTVRKPAAKDAAAPKTEEAK
jgi:small subunit ribosomal protein S3